MKRISRSLSQVRMTYIITTFFFIALSIYVYYQVNKFRDSVDMVNHTTRVTLELEKLMSSMKDAETGHRGYLLTHDTAFLDLFYSGLREYAQHEENLRLLTLDNDVQQQNLLALKPLGHARKRYMLQMLEIDKTRKPTTDELMSGKLIMDGLRARINSMNNSENELSYSRRKNYSDVSFLTPLFIIVLFLGSSLILYFSYHRLNRATSEVGHLHKALRDIVSESEIGICMLRGPRHYVETANKSYLVTVNNKDICYKFIHDALPELEGRGLFRILDSVYKTGVTIEKKEVKIRINPGTDNQQDRIYNFTYRATYNEKKKIDGVVINANDISEEIKTLKEVEASHHRYVELINKLPIAMYTCDIDGYLELYNEAAVVLWGRVPEIGIDKWCGAWKVTDTQGNEIPLEDCAMGVVVREGRVVKMDIIIERPDGTKRWIIPNPQPIYNSEGQITGAINTLIDITEQIQAREKIRLSEEKLRIAVEGGELGTFDFYPETDQLSWSAKTKEMFGLKPMDEVSFAVYSKALHPADKDNFLRLTSSIQRNGNNGMYELEYRVIGINDGQLRWLRSKGKATFDNNGKPIRFTGVTQDITQRKVTEELLRESEERFRSLAETLPQLIWVTDNKGMLEFTSSKWEQYTGIKPIGPETWREIVHPEDLVEINLAWQYCLRSGQPYKHDVRLKSKKGEYHWHQVMGEPIFDERNNILKWVGAFTDIHTAKMFALELEKQVKDRTNELMEKNLTLVRANNELELFAQISSHDLQEPLRKVQMSISRIAEKDFEILSDKGKEHFKRVQDAAASMQTLIDDLQTYSRTNNKEPGFELTDVNAILEETLEGLAETIEEKNAMVEANIKCKARINPFEFRQLFHNLISNALKFAKPDTPPYIVIQGKTARGNAFDYTKLDPVQKYCCISISDNGIGFEPQYNEKVFEIFQRLHGKDDYKGTGIGLAIVKKIVDNHNGYVRAHGVLNKGATFEIYIPQSNKPI